MNKFLILIFLVLTCGCAISGVGLRKPDSFADLAAQKSSSRWRGFNLLNMFWKGWSWRDSTFQENDFRWIHELGFNFVRLPLDYRIWTDATNWKILNEEKLKQIDDAIRFGQKYKIHVSINLHHAPGYTAGDEPDGKDLWKDPDTLAAFLYQWSMFAKRYKDIPSSDLSFNLLNEPANIDADVYQKVVRMAASVIWDIDPKRLIVVDGLNYGKSPVPELVDLPVIQANRGYDPSFINHWSPESDVPKPTWPMLYKSIKFDRQWLYAHNVAPWTTIQKQGVNVIVGEFGTHNKTPHKAVLAWMEDNLLNWKEAGWGWALWNFNGEFGILDSERADVSYEEFHGHKLDRKMLNLLQKY